MQRNKFASYLKSIDCIVVNTPTNFTLLYIGKKYIEFMEQLKKDKIAVRDVMEDYSLNGFIRISITQDMNLVIKSIQRNINLIDKYTPLIMFYTSYVKITRLLKLLEITSKIFNQNNVQYWISDGTLLSTIRHNGKFMRWDDDIDIGTIENIDHLGGKLSTYGLSLIRNKTDTYWQIRYTSDLFYPLDEFYRSENYEFAHIDVFKFYPIQHNNHKMWKCCDDRFVNLGNICESRECNLIYYDKLLFPLIKSTFENIEVNIPNKSEELLEISLGKSYKNTIIIQNNGNLYRYII